MRAVADHRPRIKTQAEIDADRARQIAAEALDLSDELEESYPGDGLALAAAYHAGKHRLPVPEYIGKLVELAGRISDERAADAQAGK